MLRAVSENDGIFSRTSSSSSTATTSSGKTFWGRRHGVHLADDLVDPEGELDEDLEAEAHGVWDKAQVPAAIPEDNEDEFEDDAFAESEVESFEVLLRDLQGLHGLPGIRKRQTESARDAGSFGPRGQGGPEGDRKTLWLGRPWIVTAPLQRPPLWL